MRPIMLELGGKDAGIVLEDADLENAAKNIVAGAFSYSGQRCTAIKKSTCNGFSCRQISKLDKRKS